MLLLGGGSLHPSLSSALLQLMPNASIWTAYGMTECGSSITTSRFQSKFNNQLNAGIPVGWAPQGISIAIRSTDYSKTVEAGRSD